MGSRHMDFPSPSGVHVPETYYSIDPDDPYRRPPPRRNRYSRSVNQTPRTRDVTWIPSPVTPQTPYAPPSPWIPPALQAPPSPIHRPPSAIPSPAPTVGEHMTLDELAFVQDDLEDPYQQPQRPGLMKSFWKGLKKLSGFRPAPSFPIPRPSSYMSQTVGMPVPQLSAPSEYVDPTPPESGTETEERRGGTPYTSPYARPARVNATPTAIPDSLRASPVLVPSFHVPAVTVVSPSSAPPSPRPNSVRSIRSARFASPMPMPIPRALSVNALEPGGATEEGSQTLHEPVYANPALTPAVAPIPVARSDDDDDDDNGDDDGDDDNIKFPLPSRVAIQAPAVDRSSSHGSLDSTVARVRRFVAGLDSLPWVSDEQIADEYIPEKNPRSRMRKRVRQGAEPSWYNPRPEVVERPAYWSEWDMWAKQSTGALWDGTLGGQPGRVGWAGVGAHGGLPGPGPGPGPFPGAMYPHGYVAAQPAYVYPWGYPPPGVANENEQGQASMLLS